MKNITSLGVAPENFETEILNAIPDSVIEHSEMHVVERRFINGLIRLMKPRRILELGVAEGAGSAVILNAIKDMPDSSLTSFDVSQKVYCKPDKDVAFAAETMYPRGNKQWKLFKGFDFSEKVDDFSELFDMAIIDTAHIHPCESLNFLTILPYLRDDAVVIFHDLTLAISAFETSSSFPYSPLANKLAYDTIVGDKLKPVDKDYLECAFGGFGFANIGVVQISKDTRKYICNVFDMLHFPWGDYIYIVRPYLTTVAKTIRQNYSPELYSRFLRATELNAVFVANGFKYEKPNNPNRIRNQRFNYLNI